MEYTFGPVPSRRLGRSLGVNPIPFKTCNYSCVYCQLGHTINFTNKRETFFPPDEMADEIVDVCKKKFDKLDYITFVGEGEPTLYKGLYIVVESIKKSCNKPIAIITNGGLFYEKEVRWDVSLFDVILSKIDAPDERTFRRINRPYKGITFEKFINGMMALKNEFKGKLWIETMLVKGINDTEDVLYKIRQVLDTINPHKRFVSIPTRPPQEEWVKIPDPDTLFKAFKILNAVPIYEVEYGEFDLGDSIEQGILTLIKRHPLRMEEVLKVLRERGIDNPEEYMKRIQEKHGIKLKEFMGFTYLLPPERR